MFFNLFRTKIDWLMLNVIKADKEVSGIAKICLEGDEVHKLPKHCFLESPVGEERIGARS